MDKEIIIDGVDVAGCEHRSDTHKELLADGAIKEFSNYCYISNDGCYGINCYYKQLKRLEQENAELQAYKDVNEDFKTAWEELKTENDKLNQENKELAHYLACMTEQRNKANTYLQEIKAIAEKPKLFKDFSEIKTATEVEYDYAAICNELELRLHKVLELITKAEEE